MRPEGDVRERKGRKTVSPSRTQEERNPSDFRIEKKNGDRTPPGRGADPFIYFERPHTAEGGKKEDLTFGHFVNG